MSSGTYEFLEEADDFVALVEKQAIWYRSIKGLALLYWVFISLLFVLALPTSSGRSIALEQEFVTCKDGAPNSWTVACISYLGVFAALERFVALRCHRGRKLKTSAFVLALAFGFSGRYDSFGDVTWVMTADACGSSTAWPGLLCFGFGVIIAQVLPALWLLFRPGAGNDTTHLAMKFNDFNLFMELIDPCHGDLELPDSMRKVALGDVVSSASGTVTPAGTSDVTFTHLESHDGASLPPPEEVARIKKMIDQLRQDELESVFEDPDEVKKKALIAQAKKVAGATRFFCEDFFQGCLQLFFLNEFWQAIDWWNRVKTVISVAITVITTSSGALAAMLSERKNREYYKQIPKLDERNSWEGIISGDWHIAGRHGVWYNKATLTIECVTRRAGEHSLSVAASLVKEEVLKEVDGEHDPSKAPAQFQAWLSSYGAVRIQMDGTYDTKSAILQLTERSIEVLRVASGTSFGEADGHYELKLFPDKLKSIEVSSRGGTLEKGAMTLMRKR